jgi:hypothetical protein
LKILATARLPASYDSEGIPMRFFELLGVIVWILIAVWLIRLGRGLDHLSKDQIRVILICGLAGDLAGWYVSRRQVRNLVPDRKGG